MSTPIVFSLEDFLNEDFSQPLFLVDKILPTAGRPGIIFGKRGAGKSHLANNLIKSVADGADFLSTYKTRQGKVTYLSVDMPIQMVQERSAKLAASVKNWQNVQISVTDAPIDIVHTLPNEEWVKKIVRFEPDLLIIDTLRK
ncbi:MAG: AAA family ATPase, partial [bacterium]